MPTLLLADHQNLVPLDLPWLEQAAAAALPLCLRHPGPHEALLDTLEEVEISLVDDAAIAQVHLGFMGIGGATDVITFQHGELIISAETARRVADELGVPLRAELLLYIIHGLLHLQGHEDAAEEEAAAMKQIQEDILRQVATAVALAPSSIWHEG